MVKQITVGLLILYVAILVITTMLTKDILDEQTAYTIQTTLDLPTGLTLIAYSMLALKLEFDKPKYRRIKGNAEILLYGGGAILMIALIYIKYLL
jgi:hypothetical protein